MFNTYVKEIYEVCDIEDFFTEYCEVIPTLVSSKKEQTLFKIK